MSGPFVLEARQLTTGYGRAAIVVRDLDLTVATGEVVALLGPNGAGKTTTLLALCGELPVLGGEVWWRGAPTRAPLHRRARQGLGLVTGERAVLMTMTVAENLRVSRCDQQRALGLFPELDEHLHRRVGLLSGGQQQMLALARALAADARMLLVDELSQGLAPAVVDRLLAAVRDAADTGVGVLLVEQYVHKALQVADRVYVMHSGRIQLSGTAVEMRTRVDEIQASYVAGSGDVKAVDPRPGEPYGVGHTVRETDGS